MASRRELVEPAGYGVVTFASTAMIVAGIGLAWTGLLLAAAGLILSIIEFKELQRLNPWLTPENLADSPLTGKTPRRIGWVSLVTTLVASAFAYAAVERSGEAIMVVGPAAIAGVTALVFNAQMRRALEAGEPAERVEPPAPPEPDGKPDADE